MKGGIDSEAHPKNAGSRQEMERGFMVQKKEKDKGKKTKQKNSIEDEKICECQAQKDSKNFKDKKGLERREEAGKR